MQWPGFLIGQRQQLERFAKETKDARTVFVIGLAVSVEGDQIFNAAAVVHRGRIAGLVPKEKLPTYNVFYEGRTFSRSGPGWRWTPPAPLGDYRFNFDFGDVAVEVCEDAGLDGPMRRRCYSGRKSSSMSHLAIAWGGPNAARCWPRAPPTTGRCCSMPTVGGQDGLIYDGSGFIFQNGRWSSRHRDSSRAGGRRWRLDRTPPAHGEHHVAIGLRGVALGRTVPSIRVDGPTAISRRSTRRLTANPPPAGEVRIDRAIARSTICSALAVGVKSYYDRRSNHWASRCRAAGTDADAAGRGRAAQLITAPHAPRIFAFYIASTRAETRNRRQLACRELGVSLQTIPIDEAVEREIEATTVLGGAPPTELTRQNVRPASAAADRLANTSTLFQTGDERKPSAIRRSAAIEARYRSLPTCQRPKDRAARATGTPVRVQGSRDAAYRSGSGAGRQAGRRTRADALPGARCLPAPLCGREDVAERRRHCAEGALPRTFTEAVVGMGGAVYHALLAVDLQVGAITAVPACRVARSRSRTGATDAGRSANDGFSGRMGHISTVHRVLWTTVGSFLRNDPVALQRVQAVRQAQVTVSKRWLKSSPLAQSTTRV